MSVNDPKTNGKPPALRLVATCTMAADVSLLDEAEALEAKALKLRQRHMRDCASSARPLEYTQAERPAWARSTVTYLRAWRRLADDGHPGVRSVGRQRLMTREAADAWASSRAQSRRPRRSALPNDGATVTNVDDEVLTALGAVRG